MFTVADISNKGLVRTVALDSSQINLLKAMTYDPKRNPTGTNEEDHIWSPEQVDGKGTGRIVILHGVPGLGKTYTVECLAEWSGKPFIIIIIISLNKEYAKYSGFKVGRCFVCHVQKLVSLAILGL